MTMTNEDKNNSVKSIFITEFDIEKSSNDDYTDISSKKKSKKAKKKNQKQSLFKLRTISKLIFYSNIRILFGQ